MLLIARASFDHVACDVLDGIGNWMGGLGWIGRCCANSNQLNCVPLVKEEHFFAILYLKLDQNSKKLRLVILVVYFKATTVHYDTGICIYIQT